MPALRLIQKLRERLKVRVLRWDFIYVSPPYSNEMATIAGTLGMQMLVADNVMSSPSYSLLKPYFHLLGVLMLMSSLGIALRRLLPDAAHRIAWHMLAWWWIIWGVGAMAGNPGALMAWATLPLAVICFSNANIEYRRSFLLYQEKMLALLDGSRLQRKQKAGDDGASSP